MEVTFPAKVERRSFEPCVIELQLVSRRLASQGQLVSRLVQTRERAVVLVSQELTGRLLCPCFGRSTL